jgi:hypothetical protein
MSRDDKLALACALIGMVAGVALTLGILAGDAP